MDLLHTLETYYPRVKIFSFAKSIFSRDVALQKIKHFVEDTKCVIYCRNYTFNSIAYIKLSRYVDVLIKIFYHS